MSFECRLKTPQSHDSNSQGTWVYLFFSYPPRPPFQPMMRNICDPVNVQQLLKFSLVFAFFVCVFFVWIYMTSVCSGLVLYQIFHPLYNTHPTFYEIMQPQVQNSCDIFFLPKWLALSCGLLTAAQLSGMLCTLNNSIRFCFGFLPLILIYLPVPLF